MLRLNPKGHYMLFQSDEFTSSFAGSEANVAVAVANMGKEAAFVSKVPDHTVGYSAIKELRKYGVDVSHVLKGGERLGIYYVERGAAQRPSKVIYDRTGSSIAQASRKEFDWPVILEGADWFHFSGITPALSAELALACADACRCAKEMGITVSIDLNYRTKLWTPEEACKVMSGLAQYADLIIGNEADAADVFGVTLPNTDIIKQKIEKEDYADIAQQLTKRFGCGKVAFTLRGSRSASINEWSAMLFAEGQAWFAPNYEIQLVDRIGGGDSFAGALIYALLSGYDPQRAIDFATASSCLKHTIENDFNLTCLADVEKLMKGDGSGRVQR